MSARAKPANAGQDFESLPPEQMLSRVLDMVEESRQERGGLPGTEGFFTPELLDLMGIRNTLMGFEDRFRRFLNEVKARAIDSFSQMLRGGHGQDLPPELAVGSWEIITSIPESKSFSSHIGLLNRGYVAAESLRSEYDMKLGIARKGLWLSQIFDLAGWPGDDVLAMRTGLTDGRILIFLEPDRGQMEGKRVLLLENDMMTGHTVSTVARALVERCGAAQVGVLTVYDHCDLSAEEFELGKSFLDPKRVIGRLRARDVEDRPGRPLESAVTEDRDTVYLRLPTDIPHVAKTHNLKQFKPEFRAYEQVRKRLAR